MPSWQFAKSCHFGNSESITNGAFKMAAVLVNLHEAVNDYKNCSEDKALATDIGGELLVLCRAVIKKHMLESERAFKFHLAQPARMLARIVAFWHMRMLRKMKRKARASRPWTVNFSWNLPLEVFDCFKVVALAPVAGGVVARNTCAVHEIHIMDMGKMKSLFLSLANKYQKRTIHESNIFLKKERDGSFSQVIVTGDYPAKFTYSKTLKL